MKNGKGAISREDTQMAKKTHENMLNISHH